MLKQSFLSKEEEKAVIQAIQKAEKGTSGEIRVHLGKSLKKDVLSDAQNVFQRLKMHQTVQRNGVLIYLLPQQKQFAIIGDIGIHKVLEEGFWEHTKDQMQTLFKEGKFVDGIIKGIESIEQTLKSKFPYQRDDSNELDDEISYES